MPKAPQPLLKGFKYRIYPTAAQEEQLTKTFGHCRKVYNELLGRATKDYKDYKQKNMGTPPSTSSFGFSRKLTLLKQEPNYSWLNEVSAVALQQSIRHLGEAFQRFFKTKKGYPQFKKKGRHDSFTLPHASRFTIESDRVRLEKIPGMVKINLHRDLPTPPRSCTVSRDSSGKYFISFLCEYIPDRQSGNGVVGIDAGLTDLYTFSDGATIDNPRHYVKVQKKLVRSQRNLSRKQKGSKNRAKAMLKVAKVHEKIKNQRKHLLHCLSAKIISENQAIGLETLQVKNMVKNHRLAKHITDASWSRFREMLTYKAKESTKTVLVLAHPCYPSTQMCSVCGSRPKEKLGLGVRGWTCSICGSSHHRDRNAAENLRILAERKLLDHPGLNVKLILAEGYDPLTESKYRRDSGNVACGDWVQ